MFEMLGDYVDERFYGCGCGIVSDGLEVRGGNCGVLLPSRAASWIANLDCRSGSMAKKKGGKS